MSNAPQIFDIGLLIDAYSANLQDQISNGTAYRPIYVPAPGTQEAEELYADLARNAIEHFDPRRDALYGDDELVENDPEYDFRRAAAEYVCDFDTIAAEVKRDIADFLTRHGGQSWQDARDSR